MAVEPGLSELVTTTLRNRTKVLKNNITNNNVVFAKGKEFGMFEAVSGGRTLIEEQMFDENESFMWYQGSELLNTAYNPTLTAPEFSWKQAAVAVTASGLEQRQNSGAEGIIKLVSSRLKVAEATMQNQINSSVFGDGTAAGGKSLGGLDLLVAKNPINVVGGIDRNTAGGAYYKNYFYGVVANLGVAASAANIKQITNLAKIGTTRGNDGANLIIAGNNYYNYFLQAAQATQMLTTDATLAKLGYENIVFSGIPVALGGGVNFGGQPLVGDNEMYMLNLKYIKLKYHKDCFMDPLEERLSINQDAMIKYLAFMGNMTMSVGKLQARIFDS